MNAEEKSLLDDPKMQASLAVWDAIVIGGGVSGLYAAALLRQAGQQVLLIEAMERLGGRIATDWVDGFALDRGFQVVLTAYPELRKALPLSSLGLKPFMSGALLRYGKAFIPLLDPFRHPWRALCALPTVLRAGCVVWGDVWRVARLRWQVTTQSEESCWQVPDQSTADFLRQYGFSAGFIHAFFKPFFGGVFLDTPLTTSVRLFRFLFRQFCLGQAALPAGNADVLAGIGAIPALLAQGAPAHHSRLNMRVMSATATQVVLESGETLQAKHVVWAAPQPRLSTSLSTQWRATTCLYYQIPNKALPKELSLPWLVLNGEGTGLINSVCVPTVVQPAYKVSKTTNKTECPEGHLLSVSLIGVNLSPRKTVEAELAEWFGEDFVSQWRWLKTDVVSEALPAFLPDSRQHRALRTDAGVWQCGDGTTYPSLNGALASGKQVAEAILANRG